jgi:hypothetical protein
MEQKDGVSPERILGHHAFSAIRRQLVMSSLDHEIIAARFGKNGPLPAEQKLNPPINQSQRQALHDESIKLRHDGLLARRSLIS